MKGLEERIVRVVLVALREGQGIAQLGIPFFLRETHPTSSKGDSFSYTTYLKGGGFKFNVFSKGTCSWRS